MDKAILEAGGIGWEKGVARCLGDEDFYRSLLAMFLQDDAYARAKEACEAGSRQKLFSSCHELKGTSGNAELTRLYQAVCPLVELLREPGTPLDEVRLKQLFSQLSAAYCETTDAIRRALGL